jgi:hypothetical protein
MHETAAGNHSICVVIIIIDGVIDGCNVAGLIIIVLLNQL